nr:MAG TPA: hypothetical protein [Caudoviricetes sp.]
MRGSSLLWRLSGMFLSIRKLRLGDQLMTTSEASKRLTDLLVIRNSIPGLNTFTEYDLSLLWLRMKQQGMDRWIFCSGEVQTYDAFKTLMLSNDTWTYAGYSHITGEPCALGIFDRMLGKTVHLHYTFFRNEEAIRDKEKYAKALFDLVFENKTVDCILMLTPHCFRHSNSFARSVGAELVGYIPSAIAIKNEETGELMYGEDALYKVVSPFYHKHNIQMKRRSRHGIR